jgi:hypothetical protein
MMACSRVAARRCRIVMTEHCGLNSNVHDLKKETGQHLSLKQDFAKRKNGWIHQSFGGRKRSSQPLSRPFAQS